MLELRLKVEMVAPDLAQRSQFRLGEIGPIEMGAPQIGAAQIDPSEDGIAQISALQIAHRQDLASQVGPRELGPRLLASASRAWRRLHGMVGNS